MSSKAGKYDFSYVFQSRQRKKNNSWLIFFSFLTDQSIFSSKLQTILIMIQTLHAFSVNERKMTAFRIKAEPAIYKIKLIKPTLFRSQTNHDFIL